MTATAPPPVWLSSEGALADLRLPASWKRRDGFALPPSPWALATRRWVMVGVVGGPEEASAAVTGLVRGVGLAVAVTLEGADRRHLLEDLYRNGRVIRPDDVGADALTAQQRDLVAALASGLSLTEAGHQLGWSSRTARRRMAEVRGALGVDSTAAALTKAARLGVSPPGRHPEL